MLTMVDSVGTEAMLYTRAFFFVDVFSLLYGPPGKQKKKVTKECPCQQNNYDLQKVNHVYIKAILLLVFKQLQLINHGTSTVNGV